MQPSPLNKSWTISALAVSGAFFLCGFGGAAIADMFDIWPLPVSGFSAAFAVVSLTYLSVPKFQNQITISIFIVGCLISSWLLTSFYYPGTQNHLRIKQEHIPLAATILGGAIALLICLSPKLKGGET